MTFESNNPKNRNVFSQNTSREMNRMSQTKGARPPSPTAAQLAARENRLKSPFDTSELRASYDISKYLGPEQRRGRRVVESKSPKQDKEQTLNVPKKLLRDIINIEIKNAARSPLQNTSSVTS